MPPEANGGVFVSSEKMYDQFVKMNEQLSQMNSQLSSLNTLMADTREEQADHEQRIRAVEKWKYGIPVAYFSAILTVIASLFKFTGKP